MLHNNGAFTPGEDPINVGTSVNIPQRDGPILAHNFGNPPKNGEIDPLGPTSSYQHPTYPNYGHQEPVLGSEIHPYTPFQNFMFGSPNVAQNFENHHDNSMSKLQDFLLSGPDIHSSNAMNFTNVYPKETFNPNSSINIEAKHPLPTRTKAFHKQIGIPVHNQINFNDNLPFYSEEFRNSKPKPQFVATNPISIEKHDTSNITPIDESIASMDVTETRSETNISKPETQSTISKSVSTVSNSSYKETSNSKSQVNVKIVTKPLVNSLLRADVKPEVKERMDFDYNNPFVRDENGVKNDGDVEGSFERAVNDVQNGSPHTTYKCDVCNLLFFHAKRFLIHHKWHSSSPSFTTKADDNKLIIKIKKEVIQDGDFKCKDCHKGFPTKGTLKSHRYKTHSGTKQCTICDIQLPNWREVKIHIETNHMEEGIYKCKECDKEFKHRHTLARHAKMHVEPTVPCELCPKMFGSITLLKQHMKIHVRAVSEHSHHCSYCGKGFHEAFNLQIHERSHNNEKPFQCELCSTSYPTNSSLQRHLKVSHNNTAKPYECQTCHRVFKSENIKDRHEIRFHQDQSKLKFQCNECDMRFFKAKDVSRHVTAVHRKQKKRKHNDD